MANSEVDKMLIRGKFLLQNFSIQSSKINCYLLFNADKYNSRADTMLGALGCGALISSTRPASSAALNVLAPKAPILVPFCLNFGKFSKRLLTPPGVKKQITS